MKNGFIKVAAVTPDVRVADVAFNTQKTIEKAREAAENGAKIIVFPELGLTGYDCRDLFLQPLLIDRAEEALLRVAEETEDLDALIVVGLPYALGGKLYDAAAVVSGGEILGIVPKTSVPDHGEHGEGRYFVSGLDMTGAIEFDEEEIPFGTDLLFTCDTLPDLKLSVEIGEDVFGPMPPSLWHTAAGATVIANPAAMAALAGKAAYRRDVIKTQSGKTLCAYILAAAGCDESTTDLVFDGQSMIAENGVMLAEAERFKNSIIYTEIDVERIAAERRRNSTWEEEDADDYSEVPFYLEETDTPLTRAFSKFPFVPQKENDRAGRCEEILTIQAMGLRKRMEHIHGKCAIIGLSGGLDSTLALLVTVKAFDMLGLPRSGILCVTMPCFGTTDRTYRNACVLAERTGAELREIPIRDAVRQHFADIGHDENDHNVTYENAQARERTQILMDLANETNGLVVGTGDLSELALGWATYNGDHMSMYGVNAGVPKTLIRHLVRYFADTCGDAALSAALYDVLDTPVSPELLPPDAEGKIAQKTEDLVGPYELHDFFLYYMLRCGFAPDKIYRIAKRAFEGDYEPAVILKWLRTFTWRFFAQQYKRSCLADGPKVGSVGVSPRGDLRFPSDAASALWIAEIEKITP